MIAMARRTSLASTFGCLFLLGTINPCLGHAQALKKQLTWSISGNEIRSPRFSSHGNRIVLVTRMHWPDGHEAESYSERYFRDLESKRSNNPRIADPVVKVIEINGAVVCEAQYGWNPDLSFDGNTIVFSRQKKPISGLRELADTMAGNDIATFNCTTRETNVIAEPDSGYFDHPFFLEDGNTVVYSRNQAINGAFGGAVGIEELKLPALQKSSLITTEPVPAVPCPPGPGKTFQSMMCSKLGEQLSKSFPGLLLRVEHTGKDVFVLFGKPIPQAGDMYLASSYDLQLISAFPQVTVLRQFGKQDMRNLDAIAFQAADNKLLLYSEYWRVVSLAGEGLTEPASKNSRKDSLYSPDAKYYLTPEPSDEPDHYVLHRATDNGVIAVLPKMASVFEAVWSPNSKAFAVVGAPKLPRRTPYREELVIYSID